MISSRPVYSFERLTLPPFESEIAILTLSFLVLKLVAARRRPGLRYYAAIASASPSGLARFHRTEYQKAMPMRTAPIRPETNSGMYWEELMYMIAATASNAQNKEKYR